MDAPDPIVMREAVLAEAWSEVNAGEIVTAVIQAHGLARRLGLVELSGGLSEQSERSEMTDIGRPIRVREVIPDVSPVPLRREVEPEPVEEPVAPEPDRDRDPVPV